jgi:hypothetical protein
MDQPTKLIIIMASITLMSIIASHFFFKYYFGKKLNNLKKEAAQRDVIFQNQVRPVLAQWRIDRNSRKAIDALSEVLVKVKDPVLKETITFIMDPLLTDELIARTAKDY